MKPAWLKIGLVVVVVAGLGAAAIFLHRQNDRVRSRVADLQRRPPPSDSLRQENVRLRALLAHASAAGGAAEATDAVHAEVARARAEVAKLEKAAERRRRQREAQVAADEQALATNRDPNAGLTRLEQFQNVGQATPRAACQTLVWAATKGDAAVLADLFLLPETARAKAEELIAGLPEAARERWTPEKLAALYFTAVTTDMSAAQIADETFDGAQHATVMLRIPGVDEAKSKVALQLGAGGWQVIVPDIAIDVMRRKIAAVKD